MFFMMLMSMDEIYRKSSLRFMNDHVGRGDDEECASLFVPVDRLTRAVRHAFPVFVVENVGRGDLFVLHDALEDDEDL